MVSRLSMVCRRISWALVIALVGYFFLRDVPHYAIYTPDSYAEYWATRGYLIPHVIGAGIGILVGLLQFSSTIRRRWPVFHRRLGWGYVIGCAIGAPAAIGLAVHSDCAVCRPALGSLAIYWFGATFVAFALARRRDFMRHRQFMIRSFVAMNVFVIIRIAYKTPIPGLDAIEHRIVAEYVSCFVPLLATEVWLSWRMALAASEHTGRPGASANRAQASRA